MSATFATSVDVAFIPLVQKGFSDAFTEFLAVYSLIYRFDVKDSFGDKDLEALKKYGLRDKDIYDMTHPLSTPKSLDETTAADAANSAKQKSRILQCVLLLC